MHAPQPDAAALRPALPLPPGPRAWPLVGNVLDVRAAGDMLAYLDQQWHLHGDVFRVRILGRKFVVVAHPEQVKQVLSSRRQRYVKGKIYDSLRRVLGDGLLPSEGDAWRERRALMQPAFHRQALAGMAKTMVGRGATYFDGLRARARGAGGALTIDTYHEMVKLTLDVVIATLFGERLLGSANLNYEAFGAALEIISEGANGVLLPPWVPTPFNRKFHRTMRELEASVHGVIRAARAEAIDPSTLLGMLLESVDAETKQALDDASVRDEVFTLFVAGHETTALVLTWMVTLLAGRPDVLDAMVAEVDAVLAGRDPTFEDVAKLPYLRQVIDETLRLRGPVPVLPRDVREEDDLGGFRVSPGETVLMLLHATHRHPAFWREPDRFDPARFAAEASKDRHSWSYLPFSGGPRTCIGNMFALVESVLLVAQLLTRFRLEIPPQDHVKMRMIGTARPSEKVNVTLHVR